MNALLALPTKTMRRVLSASRVDRKSALQSQMAVALEIWLAAPLRSINFVMLRIDEHIFWICDGSRKRVVIRVPGAATKNGKPVEHFLHDDAAGLLELYLQRYRPLLADPSSPWLFPGRNGRHKHAAVLARQTKAFAWAGAGIPFHPHLIRKIATKLILDRDPAAIEIARITLGHEDLRTTRGAYTQAQARSAQTHYLKAMEERRVAAIRSLQHEAPRRSAPKSLRVGKGRRVRNGGQE
jgi:integrase